MIVSINYIFLGAIAG